MKIAIFNFTLFGINSYVVYDEALRECVVVDPGMMDHVEDQALSDFVERNKLKVIGIVNTHLHIDHVMGNRFIIDEYQAPVMASPADEFLGKRLNDQARQFGLPPISDTVEISRPLKDGDVIKVGNGELHVIAVPGHSPGGLALYDKEDGFLISGDALFEGSIGRTDLPGGDYHQLIDGIRKKLMALPDSTVVYPGHGNPTTIGQERIANPYL
ncbi:MAG: MBL fold metallo-hydrolase [Clostridium sp.]|nr:MBL fold metallo-hydrolase [Prevotella sp.]MCM1429181.1 MBL fold metallo-hydrolase [Clostridium sp.]MCM1475845.1 MBL fold metallo-hydrolase [Muribaculaceae bacterium]